MYSHDSLTIVCEYFHQILIDKYPQCQGLAFFQFKWGIDLSNPQCFAL